MPIYSYVHNMAKQLFSSISVGDTIQWNSVEHEVTEKTSSQLVLESKKHNDETTLDKETVNDFFDSGAVQFEIV